MIENLLIIIIENIIYMQQLTIPYDFEQTNPSSIDRVNMQFTFTMDEIQDGNINSDDSIYRTKTLTK